MRQKNMTRKYWSSTEKDFWRCLRKYNEVKEYHQKALCIYETIFGKKHANVASSYNNLGNDYQDLGQYNEAKD